MSSSNEQLTRENTSRSPLAGDAGNYGVEEEDPAQRLARPARLSETIEAEVIPRLMLALRTAPGAVTRGRESYLPSERDVREVVTMVLREDASVVVTYIGVLRARGASLERILLDLLAPAARLLGRMWEEDECDFTEVTLGLGRLHQVLHACNPGYVQGDIDERICGYRVLLLPVPGEQHTFGLLMVGDFLRRVGLDVWAPHVESREGLDELLTRRSFHMVGFSMSAERHLDSLRTCISHVRDSAGSSEARVMVGGRSFTEYPDLVTEVGADATASNGQEAARMATRMLARMA